jgi:hypothetical protein
MAKFVKASEDIQELVQKVAEERDLDNYIDFETIHFGKLKEVISVMKASASAEYLSNREDLVLVMIREDVFDKVDEKTKMMWIRMGLDQVAYDSEKDKVVIGAPSITVPVGFYEKYKDEAVKAALLAKYTIAQIEDEEKEKKAQEKANKKGKKKKGDE